MIKQSEYQRSKIREAVIERDRFCQFCGTPYHLSAAHIIRAGQGGEYTLENLMAACLMTKDCGKGCHGKFDHYEIEIPIRVWNRMTEEHQTEYLKFRKSHGTTNL